MATFDISNQISAHKLPSLFCSLFFKPLKAKMRTLFAVAICAIAAARSMEAAEALVQDCHPTCSWSCDSPVCNQICELAVATVANGCPSAAKFYRAQHLSSAK